LQHVSTGKSLQESITLTRSTPLAAVCAAHAVEIVSVWIAHPLVSTVGFLREFSVEDVNGWPHATFRVGDPLQRRSQSVAFTLDFLLLRQILGVRRPLAVVALFPQVSITRYLFVLGAQPLYRCRHRLLQMGAGHQSFIAGL
jgi:hypothetical protein